MTKNKFMWIALILLNVMILIGVAFIIYMLSSDNNKNIIKVNIDNGETEVVEFKNLCLIPGEESEYKILLSSKIANKYDVGLIFNETTEQSLKNYVYVRIEANGKVFCNQLLATLFDTNDLYLSIDFTEDKKNDIKIVYYLLEDVSNEAQNEEATFELLISAAVSGAGYE